MKSFFSVGKKLIPLLTCSILNVYNGVLDFTCGLAVTAAAAQSPRTTQAASAIFVLSIIPPPFKVVSSTQQGL
jgi:hypothetical protein